MSHLINNSSNGRGNNNSISQNKVQFSKNQISLDTNNKDSKTILYLSKKQDFSHGNLNFKELSGSAKKIERLRAEKRIVFVHRSGDEITVQMDESLLERFPNGITQLSIQKKSGEVQVISGRVIKFKALTTQDLSELDKFINDLFKKTVVPPKEKNKAEEDATQIEHFRPSFRVNPENSVKKKKFNASKHLSKSDFALSKQLDKVLDEKAEAVRINKEYTKRKEEKKAVETSTLTQMREVFKKRFVL